MNIVQLQSSYGEVILNISSSQINYLSSYKNEANVNVIDEDIKKKKTLCTNYVCLDLLL